VSTNKTKLHQSLEESIDPLINSNQTLNDLAHIARYLWVLNDTLDVNNPAYLDAASGRGYGSRMLADNGKVISVDINQKAIAYAMNHYNHENISFFGGDIGSSKFKLDFKTDVVVSFETLEHTSDPEQALANFYEILKPNGTIYLSVPNGKMELKDEESLPLNKFHIQSFNKNEILELVENAGFKNSELYGQNQIKNLFCKQAVHSLPKQALNDCTPKFIKQLITKPSNLIPDIADILLIKAYKF